MEGKGPVSPLSAGEQIVLSDKVQQWIKDHSITALLVLKDGHIVFEEYFLNTNQHDVRIGWSIAKSYISALIGVLLHEGLISDIDVPVTDYVPELKGSAYDGATLRNVLQMETGVMFDENHSDFWSEVNKMGYILALGGSLDKFAADRQKRYTDPGTEWNYVSIDTHVLGMVARKATGKSVTDLLEDKIIKPLGLETESYYLTDSHGAAFILGGINKTTRDYARFGQMFAQGGKWRQKQIVPYQWVKESTTASSLTPAGEEEYGYHWRMDYSWPDGVFHNRGLYGQHLYVNSPKNVVIVVNAADQSFGSAGVAKKHRDMIHEIARSIE